MLPSRASAFGRNCSRPSLPPQWPGVQLRQRQPWARARLFGTSSASFEKVIKTKIVCTIGPSSDSVETLEQMHHAGMDVARLNFSHGTHEYQRLFQNVRTVGDSFKNRVLCDIQGPKIRLGRMEQPFSVKEGDKICVTPAAIIGSPERIPIMYPNILQDLELGDKIFINDGTVQLTVTGKTREDLQCVVDTGGDISDHKGCNIPSGSIAVVCDEKDRHDLKLIAKLDPEFVAASFIGNASDVRKVRQCLADYGNPRIKIITKVERPIALKNIDEIIEASDAIMVARGDLGVEIPPSEVPIAQKEIVRKCNREGRPVIIATQMLESMTTHARPTRAEANDVFNAVLDGADAVMLSAETSVGKYPVEAVKCMDDIVAAAEQSPYMTQRLSDEKGQVHAYERTIGYACFNLIKDFAQIGYKGKVLVITNSGFTARMISKYRPNVPVVAMSPKLRTVRELNLVWGVRSLHSPQNLGKDLEARSLGALRQVMSYGYLEKDDHVIIVLSSMVDNDCGAYIGVYDLKKLMTALEGNVDNDLFKSLSA